MNVVTQTETQALESAAPLEVADPTKNLILVPLSQLQARRSARNVRTTPRMSIPELAASIFRVGLLQNLVVVLAVDREQYEVVAGDRRLTALKLLAKRKRIDADHEVPCLLVADASARTVSLAENVQRENMHPADQFAAFAALVKEGRPIEDIAADFGVSPLVVQRRLRLANVSPRLFADYRGGEVTLEQLMALSITDDHRAQEAAYYGAPSWQREASALRARLTEREIDAAHPLARFVGVDAYQQAGGAVRRDLFADDARDVYLSDADLLESLARDRLATAAEKVRAEGWAWVEAVLQATPADLQAFRRAPREQREPKAAEAAKLAKLEAQAAEIEARLEAEEDELDDDTLQALYAQQDRICVKLDALKFSLQTYSAKVRAFAGAIVTVDADGEVAVHRGLLQEHVAKVLRTLEQGGGSADDAAEAARSVAHATPKGGISEALARRLSAHRTAALQIELARNPQVALAALVHELAGSLLLDDYHRSLPISIHAKEPQGLARHAPDLSESAALRMLSRLRESWQSRLPEDGDGLFDALLALPQDALVELLAVCVAATVDVVTLREHDDNADALGRAVALDMREWWRPTAEGYFQHIPKAAIVAAAPRFAPNYAGRLSALKKDELVATAERLVIGTGWLPPMFARQSAWLDLPPDDAADATAEPEEDAGEEAPPVALAA